MGSAVSVARCEEDSTEEIVTSVPPAADNEEAVVVTEESSKEDAEEDAPDEVDVIEVATVPYDPRFPGNNQARNCYTRYNEYYKCIQDKDPDSADCKFYAKAYRSLCPSEWVVKWNEAREDGTWFGKY